MYRILYTNEFVSDYRAGITNFKGVIPTAINFTGNKFDRITLDDSKLIEVNWTNCALSQTKDITYSNSPPDFVLTQFTWYMRYKKRIWLIYHILLPLFSFGLATEKYYKIITVFT